MDMPDCRYPDILFKWIPKYQKVVGQRRMEKFKDILGFFDLEFIEFFMIFSSEEFHMWERNNEVVGMHGLRLKDSSWIGAVWRFKRLNLPYTPSSRKEPMF